ncbi:hypothetical protein V5799_000260 [Amblyomma americanum]|uniref:Peptidase M13 N-terminal domain-containing protein n=1 Tax=Amblyomma americanum TaxID=6943 RepID=A0AAQ4D3J4_AMBAM
MVGAFCFVAIFAIVFLGVAWRVIGIIRPRPRPQAIQRPSGSNASAKNPRSGPLEDSGANSYVTLLRDAVNTSADPCDNFYRFACGSWTQKHPKTSSHADNLCSFIDSALMRMREVEAMSMDREPIGKAARYVEACLAEGEDAAIRDLKTVLAEAGLTWPERSERSDFLSALFFMARRVALPVFFGVNLLQRRVDGRQTLAFTLDLAFQSILRRFQQLITTLHAAAYLRVACESMVGKGVNDTRLSEILEGLVGATDIFDVYLRSTNKKQDIMNKTSIFRIAPGITESKWNSVLQQYLNTSVLDVDYVVMFDLQSMSAILGLVNTRGEAGAKDMLGFLAIQAAIFYSSAEMRESLFGSRQAAASQQKLHCFRDTYRLFPHVLNNFLLKASNEAMKEVMVIARSVTNAYLNVLNKNTSHRSRPLERFVEDSIRPVLTLQGKFKSDDIRVLYEAYPNMSAGALLNRISIAEKLAGRDIETEEAGTVNKSNGVRRQFEFDSYFVATYKDFVLTPYHLFFPWYSPSAPRSVLYAGIGARIAAALFYDCIERSSTCRATVYKNDGCLSSRDGAGEHQELGVELQAAVAGVSVAWRAFQDRVQNASGHDSNDSIIATDSAAPVSSHAAFFTFGCYFFCGEDNGEELCNTPLQHSVGFARVFDCDRSSPMNLERKCGMLV